MRKIIFWNLDRDLEGKEYIDDSIQELLDPVINKNKMLFEKRLVEAKNSSPNKKMYDIIIDDIVIYFDLDEKNIYIVNSFFSDLLF